jgi:hypothetical protein
MPSIFVLVLKMAMTRRVPLVVYPVVYARGSAYSTPMASLPTGLCDRLAHIRPLLQPDLSQLFQATIPDNQKPPHSFFKKLEEKDRKSLSSYVCFLGRALKGCHLAFAPVMVEAEGADAS